MLILLPPSETKRQGGDGPPLDFATLSHPRLTPRRRALVRAVREVSRDVAQARIALRLGPKGDPDIARNRVVARSPTLPALDRYTGVLYDALDAATLSAHARQRSRQALVIHSALFGLVGALDPIPAYRLSHDSRLPDIRLAEHWRMPISRELAARDGLILDLRSEAYAALGPLPDRPDAVYVRVLAEDSSGQVRALNHFNKKAKGDLARALLEASRLPESVDDVIEWGAAAGVALRRTESGGLALLV